MPKKARLKTGYVLPFRVAYAREHLLAAGGPLVVVGRSQEGASVDSEAVAQVVGDFSRFAKTGALAGRSISPGKSGLEAGAPTFGGGREFAFTLDKCAVDDRALIVLAHLFLARRKSLSLQSLEIGSRGEATPLDVTTDPDEESDYPEKFGKLPFALEDEQPDSGAYTFTAELETALSDQNGGLLQGALGDWMNSLSAGAYGLAPIPPEESYCEPDSEEIVSFDNTVEWIVLKLRADPSCVDGLVNIFAAFHDRCQKVRQLTIS